MPWMPSRELLDGAQIRFLNSEFENRNNRGNTWVVGYAGSGKSVLLVHLLKMLKDDSDRNHLNKTFCVVAFTRALGDLFRTGFRELGITGVPIMTQFELRRNPQHFDYIFCDEIQDMSPETLTMVRSSGTKIITAGDSNQSIYDKDLMTATRTVRGDQPVAVLGATKKELNIIYRLTRSIIEAVKRLMPHMAQNWTAHEDLTHEDVVISLRKCISRDSECDYVYSDAKRCVERGERTAILFPHHKNILEFITRVLVSNGKLPWIEQQNQYGSKPDYSILNSYLSRQGIPIMYVGNSYGSLYEAQQYNKIIIMTYSSSKGLDFENVYLPFVNRGLFITQDATLDRATFMVAMTRSSRILTISYTGLPSEYVDTFRDGCYFIDESQQQGDIIDDGGIF